MFATELNPNFTSHKILSTFMNKVDKSKYPIKYDNIFVFTYNKLFVYEMENGHYSTLEIPISEELIALCDKYARYSKKQNMDYLLKPQPKAEMEK